MTANSLGEFFATASPLVFPYITYEITHSKLTAPVRLVQNSIRPIDAYDENGVLKTYSYAPLTPDRSGVGNTLDFKLKVSFQDVGYINDLLKPFTLSDRNERPRLIMRIYQSNDLSAPVEVYDLMVTGIPMDETTSTIEATARQLNESRTGARFLVENFTGLRPFV